MTYTFKQLSEILARMGVTTQNGSAWRIKAWQRAGYLPDIGEGTGTRTAYPLSFAWLCAVLAEFQRIGIPPSNALEITAGRMPAPLSEGQMMFDVPGTRSSITIDVGGITEAFSALTPKRGMTF